MRVKRSARLGGVEFTDWPSDHHGEWAVLDSAGISSLWGGVDVRREDVARPAAHGSFDLPGFLAPRSLSLTGHLSAPSREALDHFASRVGGLLADGGSSRLVLDGPSGSRWCDVRLGAATQISLLDATTAKFQVTVWAADPRMFGEVREFAAGQVAHQYGNFPATPTFEVTGTSGGYTFTGPSGKQFTVSSGPGSGTDRIDMSTGRVYRNGTLLVGAVTRGDLWTVPVGLPGVTHTITAGTLTVKVTDTFV